MFNYLNIFQKINHYKYSLLGFICCLSLMISAQAAEVSDSTEQSTVVQNSADKTNLIGTAKDWGLTDQEWSQYQTLMQGKSGLFYQHLQPAAVLGMTANNVADQKHFAEVYAQQEHDKIERELAFNKATFDAMRRLYPDEPIIKPFDTTPFNPGAQSAQTMTTQKTHGLDGADKPNS